MRTIGRTMIGAAAAAALLGGCLDRGGIEADDAWVRLPAVAGRPAAGYVTLRGGPVPATLLSVATDLAVRTDMHENMTRANGMTAMTPLTRLAIPAETKVRFAPGGRHLMLHGLNPALKAGTTALFTFSFADGSRLQRKARVIGAGDPAPE